MGKTTSRAGVTLTKRVIDRLTYQGDGKSRDVRWDASLPGFGVRIYPSGRKAFVIFYRAEGQQRFMTLGDFGTMTYEEAHGLAQQTLGGVSLSKSLRTKNVAEVKEEVADPLSARRTGTRGRTVSDLVKAFLELHVDAKKRPTTAKEYRRQLETHVVLRWGTRMARTVKHADVADLHTELGKRAPTQANRVVSVVSKMFSFGRLRGFVPETFVNPCRGIEKFEEHKRYRWVEAPELPRVAISIAEEPNVYLRAYFWTILFTGMRRTETRTLPWEAVDLDKGDIRLEDSQTKARRTHILPLSAPAKALLAALPRLEGNGFVFPGMKDRQPLGDVNKAWDRIRKRAGIPDVRVHDLRRSLGSWLASYGGASLPLIGAILNHSSPQTTQVYARLGEDPKRQALEDHGKRMMEAAEGLRIVK